MAAWPSSPAETAAPAPVSTGSKVGATDGSAQGAASLPGSAGGYRGTLGQAEAAAGQAPVPAAPQASSPSVERLAGASQFSLAATAGSSFIDE